MNNDEGIGPTVTPTTPTTHPDAAALAAYHDGELRGADRDAVASHVATCAHCQRALVGLSRIDAALRDLPSVEPSPRVRAAVYARMESDASSARRLLLNPWRPLARARWWALAAVAALATAIGGYDFVSQATRPAAVGRLLSATPSAASRPLLSDQQFRPTRVPATLVVTPPRAMYGNRSGQGPANLSATTAPPSVHGPLLPPITGGSAPIRPGARRFAAVPRTNARPVPSMQSAGARPGQSAGARPGQSARARRAPLSRSVTRLVVRAGDVSMRVPTADVRRTINAVTSLATRWGGYISPARDDGAGRVGRTNAATLTVRAPVASFEAIMSGLRTLAGSGLIGADSTSRDITGLYRALRTRLEVFQAAHGRLVALLNHAASIHDTMTALDRLTVVDRRIAAVRRQTLADDSVAAFSTIAVSIAAILPSRTRRDTAVSPLISRRIPIFRVYPQIRYCWRIAAGAIFTPRSRSRCPWLHTWMWPGKEKEATAGPDGCAGVGAFGARSASAISPACRLPLPFARMPAR